MKKIVILITAVFCLLSALPVYAEFEQPPITDLVGYLTEEQNEELTVHKGLQAGVIPIIIIQKQIITDFSEAAVWVLPTFLLTAQKKRMTHIWRR